MFYLRGVRIQPYFKYIDFIFVSIFEEMTEVFRMQEDSTSSKAEEKFAM
ncbi:MULTISPECIES: hypothetical protein [Staphylococcus]|nr:MULTISPECIES: hypothetical protein [Staphylococcus]MCL9747436.1 hypothetical protein [Staphylococcus aureus]MDG4943470.1 hypothetical protein [Staphylococcus agnetis]HEA6426269.1 hypothetical protein [Staphylococcus aureus]HEO8792638.1 hypothetical protein [Staphylococcus aureus]HEO8812967.1 hypothetical protein [Staphylococcus aureus]